MSVEAIQESVRAIYNNKQLTPARQREVVRLLTEHECWLPLFKLLDNSLKHNPHLALDVLLHKISIEISYLGDHERVAQRAREIVKHFGIDFATFRLKVLATIEGNWHLEAAVLKAVCLEFKAQPDQVKCMEKICSIYEKKIPDEQLLQKYYLDLLKLDPKNILALKYFKMVHSQNFEWEQMIDALRKIMRWGNLSDAYRAAQELAAVHLYSKNDPREALRIMKKHCADSPLDKSTILYDIHARLGNDRECIAILKQKLLAARQATTQAQLHMRIAAVQHKRGRAEAAMREYEQAFKKDHSQVEVVGKIIAICLRSDNWQGVLDWLRKLENMTTDPDLRGRVRRLRNAVKKRLAAIRATA